MCKLMGGTLSHVYVYQNHHNVNFKYHNFICQLYLNKAVKKDDNSAFMLDNI